MVASPNFLKQSGAQSATFTVPKVNIGTQEAPNYINGTLTVLDWAGLPAGKLKNLLNAQYGSYDSSLPPVFLPDFDAFFDAAASAGFLALALHKVGGEVPSMHSDTMVWSLDVEGYPQATAITFEAADDYMARIAVSYSASE